VAGEIVKITSHQPLTTSHWRLHMDGMIKIKLFRSPICTPEKHKRVVRGLGLRKLNQVVIRPDSPVFRGMVNKIPHLVKVVE
jgi:large subunit ribosomal protein L30